MRLRYMPSRKILKYSLFFLGFMLVSLLLGYFRGADHGMLPNRLTAIPLKGLDGESPISTPKNQPAIFYFWATWCTVCKANDPLLKASLAPLKEKGIVFISFEEGSLPHDELMEYLKEKEVDYPVAIAGKEMLRQFQVSGYPTTMFIDRSGKIRFVDAGIMNPISFWIRAYLIQVL